MFKVGDKVKISNKYKELFFIGGICNHHTKTALKILFGEVDIVISTFWENELEGEIYRIGIENFFIIKSGNKYYCFNNDYKEMELENDG